MLVLPQFGAEMASKHNQRESPEMPERRPPFTGRKGIIWWGIPTAVILAVWLHGKWYGFGLSRLWSVEFLVLLLSCLLFVGVLGGLMFGRVLGAASERLKDEHRR
jgi:hypothetical protein